MILHRNILVYKLKKKKNLRYKCDIPVIFQYFVFIFIITVHIIFDDAFELDESVDKYVPNEFVRKLYECMEDAAR